MFKISQEDRQKLLNYLKNIEEKKDGSKKDLS